MKIDSKRDLDFTILIIVLISIAIGIQYKYYEINGAMIRLVATGFLVVCLMGILGMYIKIRKKLVVLIENEA